MAKVETFIGIVALAVGCAGDDAPEGATSRCTTEWTSASAPGTFTRSVVWFNALGQPIRVDALASVEPDYYFMTYDGDGRLSSLRYRYHASEGEAELMFSYGPDQIMVSGGGDARYDLMDGRVVHFEGSLVSPPEFREIADYEYDQAGNLTAFSSQGLTPFSGAVRYSYDAYGRVATIMYASEVLTLSYSERGASTDISVTRPSGEPVAVTFEVDSIGRLVRSADAGGVVRYSYSGSTITATEYRAGSLSGTMVQRGACEPPRMSLVPIDPLPITCRNAPWGQDECPQPLPNPGEGRLRSLFGR